MRWLHVVPAQIQSCRTQTTRRTRNTPDRCEQLTKGRCDRVDESLIIVYGLSRGPRVVRGLLESCGQPVSTSVSFRLETHGGPAGLLAGSIINARRDDARIAPPKRMCRGWHHLGTGSPTSHRHTAISFRRREISVFAARTPAVDIVYRFETAEARGLSR